MRVEMSSTHLLLISLRSVYQRTLCALECSTFFKHPDTYITRKMHQHSRSDCISDQPSMTLNRALLVSKLSKYEFEKCRYPDLSEAELESLLRKRGSDYDSLIRDHKLHKKFECSVVEAFENAGVEAQVVNRYNYTVEQINWADLICAVGGDGTFLMAAGRVCGNQKPVIGFNSDPNRSEGFLSLHKKYSTNINEAVHKLKQGDFRWRFRSRIRIVLCGENVKEQPTELHDQEVLCSKQNRSVTPVEYAQDSKAVGNDGTNNQQRVLPVLALNEVFIGENLSARVSYYEMRINGGQKTKIKSSGLCVATGTGSTSWNMSINRLTNQSVAEVLRLFKLKQPQVSFDQGVVQEIAENFNNSLIFNAEDSRMGYTIRDLISAGVWPQPKGVEPRGYANQIEVKSRCLDAGLVIDGGISFKFNDGMIAKLEIHECDSLRTVELNEH